jgi:hypothetical protein
MNHPPHFSGLGEAYWIGFAVMLVVMIAAVLLLLRDTARHGGRRAPH